MDLKTLSFEYLRKLSALMSLTMPDVSDRFGLVIAGDFTKTGDAAFRAAQEIRAASARVGSVGLVQIRGPDLGEVIAAEIQTCLRRGLARIVTADREIAATALVLHEPSRLTLSALPGLMRPLQEVAIVCHQVADLAAARSIALPSASRIKTFALTASLRAQSPYPIEHRDWLPVLPEVAKPWQPRRSGALALGWLDIAGLNDGELRAALEHRDLRAATRHFGLDDAAKALGIPPLPALSLDRIVAGLDAMIMAPAPGASALPDTLIASGLQAGLPILMPDRLQPVYGSGPIYFAPQSFERVLRSIIWQDPKAKLRRSGAANFVARCRKGPAATFPSQPRHLASAPEPKARPILCLAANGVGVGHLTRLLAVARRTEGEVVFATHAPAAGLVQHFGYPVEYIPSAAAVDGDFLTWDAWFKVHLDRVIDKWDPVVVVYDGNHPTQGLIEAVAARRDCRLVWMRRGMWASTTSPYMDNARFCDLIIEPGDIAGDLDHGVTARRRSEALQVDPIRLLEDDDLLTRAEAAAALGLNPARPAVLIQLGSGFNRDLLSLLDQIIKHLAAEPGLQIAVAEWVNGSVPLTLWPQVTVLRGFPISQYLRAFDFCISAAGYNSFHELISAAMPTIFVANRHPSMDDQHGRAQFAQDKAAAFELSETDLADLPDLVKLLSQTSARSYLARNCAALTRPNGARTAANAVTDLARQPKANAS